MLRAKKYSVLLLYPEGDRTTGPETYFTHVEASGPEQAVTMAKWRADWDNNGLIPRDAFIPLAVFKGHIEMELGVLDFT